MEVTNPMLHIDEEIPKDDSIKAYKWFAYQPINSTQIKNASPIVIRVENCYSYFGPCDLEVEFEGKKVVKSSEWEQNHNYKGVYDMILDKNR